MNELKVLSAAPTQEEFEALQKKYSASKLRIVRVSTIDARVSDDHEVEAVFVIRKPTAQVLLETGERGTKKSLVEANDFLMKYCIVYGNKEVFEDEEVGGDIYFELLEKINELSGQKKAKVETVISVTPQQQTTLTAG